MESLSAERGQLRSNKLDLELKLEETKQRLQQQAEANQKAELAKVLTFRMAIVLVKTIW